MIKKEIQISKEFKTQAIAAILAISFFLLTYLIILLLAILFTGLCIFGGFILVVTKPMFLTLALGIGLASLGVLVLIFLLKFIFKSHKVDRSHLVEIKEYQEPELFNLIKNIVQEVGTSFPKKVYLSSEVNASVFYDSSFWSMFLPVKKNLQIGLGLINTITKEELKAILSHEFGHFSQRTMKIGSYVYNVNQIIFNMLFDNESYENLIQGWANVSGFFSFFVAIAVKIIEEIQWILRKLYEVVNKNYMGLSREMEFHADEIAASITGYEPLKKSLLRIALANNSFNNVLNFYENKISDNIKSENLYKDQSALLHFLAEVNTLVVTNNLPDISLEEQSKFDKSRLVIKDQWASHPSIKERIKRLEETGYSSQSTDNSPANCIIKDVDKLQKQLTDKIFEVVTYQGEAEVISSLKFLEVYKQEALSNSFSKIYNGYYDNKNPVCFDLSQINSSNDEYHFNELYADDKVDLVYTAIALQNDIEIIKNISNKALSVKTFDYDGVKYKHTNADSLIEQLNQDLNNTNALIKENDVKIYNYFKREEILQNKPKQLERLYNEFFDFDAVFDSKYEIYTKLLNELQFVSVTTPLDQIRSNLNGIISLEDNLKQEINKILMDEIYTTEITNDIKLSLEQYSSKSWEYFNGTSYNNDNLNLLYKAMTNFAYLFSRKYFLMKKKILTWQEELEKKYTTSHP